MKKLSLAAVALCLLLVLLSPGLTGAQGGLTVLDSSTQAQFPSKLQFNLSVSGDSNITDIRLRYTVDRQSFAQVTSEGFVQFVPATRVNASWSLDMVKTGGLPPGAGLKYWWVVKDAKGNRLETQPTRIQFNDNRYQWLIQTRGKVTLYWYQGDQSFADNLLTASQQALDRLATDTGATLSQPIELYIYASPQDLLGAMIHPQEWTGGVAYVGFGIIAIAVPTNQLDWGRGAIAHEIAHLVTNQMTQNPYSGLPTWLDEGLAVYAEGTGGADYISFVNNAVARKSLISVRSLCSPFSAIPEMAYLSYGESYSLVNYLISQYGQGKMVQLLNAFQQGNTYDNAFKKVYGFDIDGLNALWQANMLGQSQKTMQWVPVPLPSLAGAGS